jgi:hypothetical protein
VLAKVIGIGPGPAGVDPHVAAVDPSQRRQPLLEDRHAGLKFRIVRRGGHQHTDPPQRALARLRPRRERP